jgi:hypothetical protein
MTRALRPLSLSQVLDETFDIYRRNWLLFVGISALPNLVLLLLQIALEYAGLGQKTPSSLALLATLATSVASWFFSSIVTAATTFAVSDIYLDRPTSVWACFSRVQGKALRVCLASFLVSLIVGLGFLLCMVPGLYWAGKYGVAIPAVVLEDVTAGGSMNRSSDLTSGSTGRVIVVYFLTSIFTILIVTGLVAGLALLSPALFQHTGVLTRDVLERILASAGEIVFGPVTAIGLTLVYYDLRVRKEAFDLEHMMRMMAPENLATGTSAS